MNCSDCRKPMCDGSESGVPIKFCRQCGKVVKLPMAGPTTQHSTKSRTQTANAIPREPSAGEVSFAEAWRDFHPSLPFETEYKFHLFRDFRLDFAFVEAKVAVEFEGRDHQKTWTYAKDLEKYNMLAYEGWLLFRTTKAMLDKDAERFCRMVAETIRKRLSRRSEQASSSSE